MTVIKNDLEKALEAAETAKDTYAVFAAQTADQEGQQMFQQMSQDMERHVANLQGRLKANSPSRLISKTEKQVGDLKISATE